MCYDGSFCAHSSPRTLRTHCRLLRTKKKERQLIPVRLSPRCAEPILNERIQVVLNKTQSLLYKAHEGNTIVCHPVAQCLFDNSSVPASGQ
jgi:hypothetical protein